MKNNRYWIILGFAVLLIFSSDCGGNILKKDFNQEDIDSILAEFTNSRISQYLYSDESPRDNITLLVFLVKQHGFSYSHFLEKLKEYEPELYRKLFVKPNTPSSTSQ